MDSIKIEQMLNKLNNDMSFLHTQKKETTERLAKIDVVIILTENCLRLFDNPEKLTENDYNFVVNNIPYPEG